MNDWEIKKFLRVVLAIQLAVWSVIGLDAIGLHTPVIRQLAGFGGAKSISRRVTQLLQYACERSYRSLAVITQ